MLRPRRRLNVWCASIGAGSGPGAMTSPAGIPNFLVEGSSIAQSAVGVKGLGQTPLLIADRSSNPWEDYNYKSFRVTLLGPSMENLPP